MKIYNISEKEIEITPKTTLCELQEVKVLKNLDLETEAGEKMQGCQQTDKETTLQEDNLLPSGIDLKDSAITEEPRQELTKFLLKWKGIFSGLVDLGDCDKVKHRINLHDDKLFKDPHQRIPPALFQEVREHLQEMLNAGAIRPSKSPYSSNVVIVRKKDGTIRCYVDFGN